MAGEIDVGALISAVDIFFPNKIEFERLTDLGLSADVTPLTVVKCGADGARAFGKDGWESASCDPTDVIDATGAGDSFNGGFLSVWLEKGSLDDCLKRGNQCGHLAVQSKGGVGAFKHWCDLA